MAHYILEAGMTITASLKAIIFFGYGLRKKNDMKEIDKKIEKYFEDHKGIVKTRSAINMLRWAFNDNFESWLLYVGSANMKKLDSLKEEFLNFYFLNISKNKSDIKLNIDVHNKIDEYMIRIMKLRMIIEPDIQIALNVHTQTKITYLIAKSYWIDEDGNKVRKFTKSLGRAEEFKDGINDINAKQVADKKIKEIMIQTYKDEHEL